MGPVCFIELFLFFCLTQKESFCYSRDQQIKSLFLSAGTFFGSPKYLHANYCEVLQSTLFVKFLCLISMNHCVNCFVVRTNTCCSHPLYFAAEMELENQIGDGLYGLYILWKLR